VRLAIGLVPVSLLAIALFGFNLYGLGLALVAFFINLILTSWAVGIFVSGLVLRNGMGAESFAWTVMFLLMPLACVYYPVAVLPGWLQWVALALPPTLRTAAVRWRAGRGGHELTAVSSQLGGTLQAGGVKQYAQMRASCALLAATVAKAQAGPPIPDGTMQALYARSLASLAKGASNCHAAISQQPDGDEYVVTTENQALMHQAASQFSEGAKDLYRATAEIEALGGHH